MHQNLVPPYGPRRSMILLKIFYCTVVQKSTHTSVFPLWVYVQSLLDGILNVFSSFAPPPSILSLSLLCTCVCTQSVCVCLYVVARDPPVSSPRCLGYKHVPPHLAFMVCYRSKPRASELCGKHLTIFFTPWFCLLGEGLL